MNDEQLQRFEEGLPLCPICHYKILPIDGITLECNHQFHKECLGRWAGMANQRDVNNVHNKCPLCRAPIEVKRTDKMIRREILEGGKRRRKSRKSRKSRRSRKYRKSRRSRKYRK